MAKQKTKRKKHYHKKRAFRGIKGIKWCWEDTDPLTEGDHNVTNVQIGHDNYCYAKVAEEFVLKYKDWLTQKQKFDWSIEINVVFTALNDSIQHETRQIFARNEIFNNLDPIANEQIKDAMTAMDEVQGEFITTQFIIICLGINSPLLRENHADHI